MIMIRITEVNKLFNFRYKVLLTSYLRVAVSQATLLRDYGIKGLLD